MTESLPSGLCSVLVTPFTEMGAVDDGSLDRLANAMIDEGARGLVPLAVTGESGHLKDDERDRVVARVMAVAKGRVPVVVGVLDECTRSAARFAGRTAQRGASALLVAPPWTPGMPAIIEHMREVAGACGLPLVLLDYPPLRGQVLDAELMAELVDAVPQIVGIKLEGVPTLPKVAQFKAALGDRLKIYGASGGLHAPQMLARGVHGLMTGYAYPTHLVSIIEEARRGNPGAAAAEYARWLPLMVYVAQRGLGVALRKEVLRLRGIIDCGRVRPPTKSIDLRARMELIEVIEQTVGVARTAA
ncbi:MAG: dihydrodipicolinate synthase family protein [Deltaproteobacteria bacterium]|nr:dihydrodipicolinate synthase family protein [Deltaproteobacteria bacterium]